MKQGEIWLVSFMPQIGTEIAKTRPAVILSHDNFGFLTTRIVVPIRDYKPHHTAQSFFIPLYHTGANGLTKISTADCSQVKSFDTQRFLRKPGTVTDDELEEIIDAINLCFGR